MSNCTATFAFRILSPSSYSSKISSKVSLMSCSSSSLIPKNGLGGMLTLTEATLFHCPPILNVRYFFILCSYCPLITKLVCGSPDVIGTCKSTVLTSDRMLVLSCVVLVTSCRLPPVPGWMASNLYLPESSPP